MIRNQSGQKVTLLAIDAETGLPKTGDGANITFYVSKDDGAVAPLNDTTATELDATNAPGLYSCDLTQAETDAYKLSFSGKSSTANVVVAAETIYSRPQNFSVQAIDSSGRSQVQYGTGTGQINLSGGNLAGAVPSVTAGVTVTTNNDKAGYSLSPGGVQAIWDALTSALTTVGSIGKLLVDNINATISSRLASSSYTAPDNAGISTAATQASTAATQATAAAASALSADGKLDTAFTNMKTRFLTMIESYSGGTLWRFLTGALSQAPSGGGGGSSVRLLATPLRSGRTEAVRYTRGTEGVDLRDWITDASGNRIDLTGHVITATLLRVGTEAVVFEDEAASLGPAPDEGQVELAWPANSLDTPGQYKLIWKATMGSVVLAATTLVTVE